MKHIKLYENFLNEVHIEPGDEMDLWYVIDHKKVVKNLSKTEEDANTFLDKLEKVTQEPGKVRHAVVSKKDYEDGKINTSNIKSYDEESKLGVPPASIR